MKRGNQGGNGGEKNWLWISNCIRKHLNRWNSMKMTFINTSNNIMVATQGVRTWTNERPAGVEHLPAYTHCEWNKTPRSWWSAEECKAAPQEGSALIRGRCASLAAIWLLFILVKHQISKATKRPHNDKVGPVCITLSPQYPGKISKMSQMDSGKNLRPTGHSFWHAYAHMPIDQIRLQKYSSWKQSSMNLTACLLLWLKLEVEVAPHHVERMALIFAF